MLQVLIHALPLCIVRAHCQFMPLIVNVLHTYHTCNLYAQVCLHGSWSRLMVISVADTAVQLCMQLAAGAYLMLHAYNMTTAEQHHLVSRNSATNHSLYNCQSNASAKVQSTGQ
jgi:hypothetical protein